MTTKDDVLAYVTEQQRQVHLATYQPIYAIFMIEHADKELIYPNGKHSGFPDMGASSEIGFYYSIDSAINALESNACDLRETVYDAGFILCRFPGLYESSPKEARMYFVWDDDEEGYIQKEEPLIFKHIGL